MHNVHEGIANSNSLLKNGLPVIQSSSLQVRLFRQLRGIFRCCVEKAEKQTTSVRGIAHFPAVLIARLRGCILEGVFYRVNERNHKQKEWVQGRLFNGK